MSIMDTRPDHAGSMRLIATAVARDLGRIAAGERIGEGAPLMGLTNLFRIHSHWSSHAWYGDPEKERFRQICDRVFAGNVEDPRSFARGLRSAAGIVVRDSDEAPGTAADRDVFWRCVAALSEETGVAMPARPAEPVLAVDFAI